MVNTLYVYFNFGTHFEGVNIRHCKTFPFLNAFHQSIYACKYICIHVYVLTMCCKSSANSMCSHYIQLVGPSKSDCRKGLRLFEKASGTMMYVATAASNVSLTHVFEFQCLNTSIEIVGWACSKYIFQHPIGLEEILFRSLWCYLDHLIAILWRCFATRQFLTMFQLWNFIKPQPL